MPPDHGRQAKRGESNSSWEDSQRRSSWPRHLFVAHARPLGLVLVVEAEGLSLPLRVKNGNEEDRRAFAMGHVKLNLSMDSETAREMKRRAREEGAPVSQYLASLIRADVRRKEDLLAAEGYASLGAEMLQFARDVFPLADETWPRGKEQP